MKIGTDAEIQKENSDNHDRKTVVVKHNGNMYYSEKEIKNTDDNCVDDKTISSESQLDKKFHINTENLVKTLQEFAYLK